MRNQITVLSFGGGVQSTAILCLLAEGSVKTDAIVFADVGADSENPDTLEYMELLKARGYLDERFVRVQATRYKQSDTVYQAAIRDNRSIPIPVKFPSGAYGNRSCTVDFKIKPVDRWIQDQGFTHATIQLGFSTDEARRAVNKPTEWHDHHKKHKFGFNKRFAFPLLEIGLSRRNCHDIIARHNLPQAPKSACWFCPFSTRSYWIELRKHQPELFEKALALEQTLQKKAAKLERTEVYLHVDAMPLDLVPEQLSLWDIYQDTDNACQEGYCGL